MRSGPWAQSATWPCAQWKATEALYPPWETLQRLPEELPTTSHIILGEAFFFFFFNWSIIALSFPGVSVVKNFPSSAGDTGLIPGWGRSSGEGNGNPLQYSCLGKSHGQRSLAGYSPRGCKGLDMTERLNNNSIVALQCCVSFCRTTNWISYILTYISSLFSCPPPTPPSHSSRSSQSRKFYLTHWRESNARCLNRSA